MHYQLLILDEILDIMGNAGSVPADFLIKLITEAEKKGLPFLSSIDYRDVTIFNIMQLEQLKKELLLLKSFFKDDENIQFSIFKNAAISVIEQETYQYLKIAKV